MSREFLPIVSSLPTFWPYQSQWADLIASVHFNKCWLGIYKGSWDTMACGLLHSPAPILPRWWLYNMMNGTYPGAELGADTCQRAPPNFSRTPLGKNSSPIQIGRLTPREPPGHKAREYRAFSAPWFLSLCTLFTTHRHSKILSQISHTRFRDVFSMVNFAQ